MHSVHTTVGNITLCDVTVKHSLTETWSNDNSRKNSDRICNISLHRIEFQEDKDHIKMLCGECGNELHTVTKLANHINHRGFMLKRSQIKFYDRETFDANAQFDLVGEDNQQNTMPPQTKSPRNQHHATLDDRTKIQQRCWVASNDHKKVATKSQSKIIHRSDTDTAFDSHYSLPAAQVHCQLALLMQTNPEEYVTSSEIPSIRTVISFTTPPGLS